MFASRPSCAAATRGVLAVLVPGAARDRFSRALSVGSAHRVAPPPPPPTPTSGHGADRADRTRHGAAAHLAAAAIAAQFARIAEGLAGMAQADATLVVERAKDKVRALTATLGRMD